MKSDRHDAYTRKALQAECDAITSAPNGDQNNTINAAAFSVGTLVGAGALSESEARGDLLAAARAGGHPDGRARASVESGLAAGMSQPRHPWPPVSNIDERRTRRSFPAPPPYFEEEREEDPFPDEEASAPRVIPGLLPASFFAARPELQQIRQAAHSRNRSGDVAFYSTLARLSGMIPHHIRADTGVADFVSLNLFVALVGPSGSGKSTGVRVGKRLMEAPAEMDFRDGLPIGSGEGMAEVFMGTTEEPTGEIIKGGAKKGDPVMVTVRAQVRHNAFFYVDEGASLTRLMNERSGSTLGETLRSAAVGQTLGQTNASKDNTRYIPGGSYSMGLLVGFQPETAAPLFEDVAEGTPQRFLWGTVTDPSIPDKAVAWPGELRAWRQVLSINSEKLITFDEAITTELRRVDLANARGEAAGEGVGPLDSHAPVMKIKVSSLLAILAGRLHVTVEDWELAETVWAASCAARDWVIAYSERQRRAEAEKRTVARISEELRLEQAKAMAENERADKAVDRLATRLAGVVHQAGGATRKELRAKVAGRDKKHVSSALELAVLRGWIEEEAGRITPGRSRPT
ncbi:hypothetical protein ABZ501_06405 [Streptomyces sp. NPDC019922]|uniref:hypothetical protein n=1 Tax=Streptomyces sp. NPDC019922 TaxID=3156662 RepID=UPI00340E0F0A